MLYLEGFLPFLIIVFSAFFHETGHFLAIKKSKCLIRRLDILPKGALIVYSEENSDYSNDIRISLSGPLFSLALSAFSFCLFLILKEPYSLFACILNIFFGLFNLVPEKKLDGGRALYAFLMKKYENEKAERISSALSVVSKIFFICLGTVLAFLSDFNSGVLTLVCVLLVQILM